MTPHTHRVFVPGCYRCDLNREEERQWAETEARGDDDDSNDATIEELRTRLLPPPSPVERAEEPS